MNIFALDKSPILAAQMQCDRHVVKMALETAQLLSTAHRRWGYKEEDKQIWVDLLYKETHANHPCALWVRETMGNYVWAETHLVGLLSEYTKRYGRTHKVEERILPVLRRLPIPAPLGRQTPFAQAMPEQYRGPDAVEAYRRYYIAEKAGIASWAHSPIPCWYQEAVASQNPFTSAGA